VALNRLAARITRSKKRLDPATVNRQIGRILQQNRRDAPPSRHLGGGWQPGRFPPRRGLQSRIR
jgi:hypothetical protein